MSPEATVAPVVGGVKPTLLEGQRVQVVAGPFAGRMAYVVGHEFASDQDYIQFMTAGHPKRYFSKVSRYLLKTRDSRAERISAEPSEIEALDVIDGWGRGQAPENAPADEPVAEEE